MKIATWIKGHLLGWTVLTFGAGAAFAVAVIGVPKLWSAEAAGWASAIVTFAAVVVALVTAHRQLNHAREAVAAERATAEGIQQREWELADRERALTTMRLAFAFSRELAYARRSLASRLLEWEPDRIAQGNLAVLQEFVGHRPLGDLDIIRTFANRLDGFSDEDTFRILTVLSTWQFFNGPPATNVREMSAATPDMRAQIAQGRLRFGFALMDTIDQAINEMAKYYGDHESITGSVSQEAPDPAEAQLRNVRNAL